MRCNGETYIAGSADEDGRFTVLAECDGGPGGDCGWAFELEDKRGDLAWGINTTYYNFLHAEHLDHSERGAR